MKLTPAIGLFSLAILAACAAPSSAAPDALDAEKVEADSADLTGKPRYTTTTRSVLGEYTNDNGCTGGFEACETLQLRRLGGRLEIGIGNYGQWGDKRLVAKVQESSSGVLVFTTGDLADELPWADCPRNPGCGNLLKVNGVIYPVVENGRWVPRIKATYRLEFLHPDEEGAPDGEVHEVLHLTKK